MNALRIWSARITRVATMESSTIIRILLGIWFRKRDTNKFENTMTKVSAAVITRAGRTLVVTAKGYGKKTKLSEYKIQKRSGSGIKTAKVNDKTGSIMGAVVLGSGEGDILAISKFFIF